MGRAFSSAFLAAAAISLLAGCGGPDDDEALREAVLSCIADAGARVDEGADVAIAGGEAVAVVGPVEASEALIGECLDLANR